MERVLPTGFSEEQQLDRPLNKSFVGEQRGKSNSRGGASKLNCEWL